MPTSKNVAKDDHHWMRQSHPDHGPPPFRVVGLTKHAWCSRPGNSLGSVSLFDVHSTPNSGSVAKSAPVTSLVPLKRVHRHPVQHRSLWTHASAHSRANLHSVFQATSTQLSTVHNGAETAGRNGDRSSDPSPAIHLLVISFSHYFNSSPQRSWVYTRHRRNIRLRLPRL